MPRIKKTTERFQKIQTLLKTENGISIKAICEKINAESDKENRVTEKTIRNNIDEIKTRVDLITVKRGYYRYSNLNDNYFEDSIKPEFKQAIEQLYSFFALAKDTKQYEKIGIILNDFIRDELIQKQQDDENGGFIQMGNAVIRSDIQWIEQIYDAVLNKQTLEIYYASINKFPEKRIICPYLLKEFDNEWFVIAYSIGKADKMSTNVFKLKRIKSIALSNQKFQIDPNFNTQTYFNNCIGIYHQHGAEPQTIKLRASSKLKYLIQEKPFHHSMQIIENNEDSIDFTAHVYITDELLLKIIGYGKLLKVLEPYELRQNIKNELKKMALLYND